MDFGVLVEKEEGEVEVLEPSGELSLEVVKPSFLKIVTELDKMESDATELVVKDADTASFAVALGGAGKKMAKALEVNRKKVIEKPMERIREINGFVKIFTDKLDRMEVTLKRKVGQYQNDLELARRVAEKKQQEEAAALKKRLEEEAKEKGVEAPEVIAPVVHVEKPVVRAETGSSSYQAKVWKGEIVNPELVPIKFCSPDQKKINEAVKAGVREIEGVRIFEDSQTKFRA